jgi:Na+-translocating ferredoxin:NAD+ oxidoreductase RNF subunit RnfB
MKNADEMRVMLRAACDAAGSQTAWARANGVSTAYVNDCLAGRREIGESIAKAMGYQPVRMYKEMPRHRQGARGSG